jgi:hypothetical protein
MYEYQDTTHTQLVVVVVWQMVCVDIIIGCVVGACGIFGKVVGSTTHTHKKRAKKYFLEC